MDKDRSTIGAFSFSTIGKFTHALRGRDAAFFVVELIAEDVADFVRRRRREVIAFADNDDAITFREVLGIVFSRRGRIAGKENHITHVRDQDEDPVDGGGQERHKGNKGHGHVELARGLEPPNKAKDATGLRFIRNAVDVDQIREEREDKDKGENGGKEQEGKSDPKTTRTAVADHENQMNEEKKNREGAESIEEEMRNTNARAELEHRDDDRRSLGDDFFEEGQNTRLCINRRIGRNQRE